MKKVSLVVLVTAIVTLGYAVVTYAGEHCCADDPVAVGYSAYIADFVGIDGEFACISPLNWFDPGGGGGTGCNHCGRTWCPPFVRTSAFIDFVTEVFLPLNSRAQLLIFREYAFLDVDCRGHFVNSGTYRIFHAAVTL